MTLLTAGNRDSVVQPLGIHFTDWAIPV